MNIYKMPSGDLELPDYYVRRNPNFIHFVWLIISRCNLRCPYCVGKSFRENPAATLLDKFSPVELAQKFNKISVDHNKKICITFTGGEPTLCKNFTAFCNELTNLGIYFSLQTNLVSNTAEYFTKNIANGTIFQVEAAYHHWLLDKDIKVRTLYFDNMKRLQDRGIPCVLKLVLTPEYLQNYDERISIINKNLSKNIPILHQLYIANSPKLSVKCKNAYPYAYTQTEKMHLDKILKYRRNSNFAYMNGAGFFKGMLCATGRDYGVIDILGTVLRCGTGAKCVLGNIVKDNVKMLPTLTPCSAGFCSCTQWGMWYGKDPWNYIPNVDKTKTFWNRFGKDPSLKDFELCKK